MAYLRMLWRQRFRFPIAVFMCATLTATSSAQTSAAIEQKVHTATQGFPGKVSLYAKNLVTGASYELSADSAVPTASTIKLPIMIELFAEAAQGKLDWNQTLTLTEKDKTPGSGVLTEFSPGDRFPLRDLMHLMIVVSDNTATNLLLTRIGGDAVNVRMAQLGLHQTAVLRRIFQADNQPKGVTAEGGKPENARFGTGKSSPRDMVTLLEKLYRGELVSKTASEEMLSVLKRQHDHSGAGRDRKDTVIASKSGALDHLRSDVALVYSPRGPVAMAITVEGIPQIDYGVDNQGDLLIAALAEILIEGLSG